MISPIRPIAIGLTNSLYCAHQSPNRSDQAADPSNSSQNHRAFTPNFIWLKTALSRAVKLCAQIANKIIFYLFQFPDHITEGDGALPNPQLLNPRVESIGTQDQDGISPLVISNREHAPSHLLTVCSQIALNYLQPTDVFHDALDEHQMGHLPHNTMNMVPRPSLATLSAFLNPSLAAVVFSERRDHHYPNWLSIHTWHIAPVEIDLRDQLADLVSLFCKRSVICDRDLVMFSEIFCNLSLRRSDEIDQGDSIKLKSLKELLENRLRDFGYHLRQFEPDFLEKMLKAMCIFSEKANPALDELVLSALKSGLVPYLKLLWAGNDFSSRVSQERLTITSSLIKGFGLSGSSQIKTLCKLILFDSLCLSSTAFVSPHSPPSCHQLAIQKVALWHTICFQHLLTRVWHRVIDLQFQAQIRSGVCISDPSISQLSSKDIHCLTLLFFLHYLHRIVRSELSGRILGAGKYNALILWQAERLIVDPMLQNDGQLAQAMWVFHLFWPLICVVSLCLPLDLKRRPYQALHSLTSKCLDALWQKGHTLFAKLDNCIVNCFDDMPIALGGEFEELMRRHKAREDARSKKTRGFYLKSDGKIANCSDINEF